MQEVRSSTETKTTYPRKRCWLPTSTPPRCGCRSSDWWSRCAAQCCSPSPVVTTRPKAIEPPPSRSPPPSRCTRRTPAGARALTDRRQAAVCRDMATGPGLPAATMPVGRVRVRRRHKAPIVPGLGLQPRPEGSLPEARDPTLALRRLVRPARPRRRPRRDRLPQLHVPPRSALDTVAPAARRQSCAMRRGGPAVSNVTAVNKGQFRARVAGRLVSGSRSLKGP